MPDENSAETVFNPAAHEGSNVNWTRIEGVVGVGALLTSFLWFLGMPTGMAIGIGFGTILLLDFIRQLLFGSSRAEHTHLSTPERPRT